LIGISQQVKHINELVHHVADSGLNVIISGESGVGKEVVAQNLYHYSPRRGNPFIKINCAALPEGLLESELFGYEQGAFTGAKRRKRGKLELAHGGVLLLDEIGDMSLALQAKLLQALQSGEFSPLGSEKETRSDTWIMAATNHDLYEDIEAKTFREDLYYRLNIISITIPPLRNRPEDISPLAEYFVAKYATELNIDTPFRLTPAILMRFEEYPWPGNARELQNILKRMMILGNWEGALDELMAEKAAAKVDTAPLNTPSESLDGRQANNHPICSHLIGDMEKDFARDGGQLLLKRIKKRAIDQIEKEVITFVLNKTGWNRSKTANILGVSYKTLFYKVRDLGIKPPV
jgi:transcriptional regulator with PAS, ATPase and Fis domain